MLSKSIEFRNSSGALGFRELIEVVSIRLDVEPEAVRAAAALLTDDETKRAQRFTFECDRRRFTVARSRLRRLLGGRLNVRPEAVELVYGMRGKPALSPRYSNSNLQFNVSHSEEVAVFAFSSGLNVGIDIETLRDGDDVDEVVDRFFSPREIASYRALDRSDRSLGFFTCWTRKEAFVKALGAGLYQPLNTFDVSSSAGEPTEVLQVCDDTGERSKWLLRSFSPGPDLVGAIAVGRWASPYPHLACTATRRA